MIAALFVAASAQARTPLGVLRALESLPVWKHDRGPEHAALKAAQMREVSGAITEHAKGDKDLEALLMTDGWHESAWSLAIQNGVCGPRECDRDRKGNVRAHSNYQLHRQATSSREAWEAARTDVHVATREAVFALRRARNMCRSKQGDVIRMTLAAYAGSGCGGRLRDVERRVATFRAVRGRL